MSILLRKFIAEAIAADREGNPAVSGRQLIPPDENTNEVDDVVDEISVAGSIAGSVAGPPVGPGARSRGKRRQSSARWK